MPERNSVLEVSDKLSLKIAINSLIKDLDDVRDTCQRLKDDPNATDEDREACDEVLVKYDNYVEDLKDQGEAILVVRGDEQFKSALERFSLTAQAITNLINENFGTADEEEVKQ